MIGVAFAADAPQQRTIPIFATGPNTGWVLDRAIGPDDLIPTKARERSYCSAPCGSNSLLVGSTATRLRTLLHPEFRRIL